MLPNQEINGLNLFFYIFRYVHMIFVFLFSENIYFVTIYIMLYIKKMYENDDRKQKEKISERIKMAISQ